MMAADFLHRRRLKQRRQRQSHPDRARPAREAQGEERVAAQGEEVVVEAERRYRERLMPDRGQPVFELVAGRPLDAVGAAGGPAAGSAPVHLAVAP